jgi:hypothetical protein
MIEKGFKCIMVECHDKIVTKDSLVCISPYNEEKGEWMSGLNELIPLSEVLKMNVRKATKDKNMEEFFEKQLGVSEEK